LIPAPLRKGRILDIGSGSYPLFLSTIEFSQKYALDRLFGEIHGQDPKSRDIFTINHDLETTAILPFHDAYFDVVAMLAVIEHLTPGRLAAVFREVHRILKEGGLLIITTPVPWVDRLLWVMARLRLVSSEEIMEHKGLYDAKKIVSVLREGNFEEDRIQVGYFELRMNSWITVAK
jgi:SAM-dependent methyltransferase